MKATCVSSLLFPFLCISLVAQPSTVATAQEATAQGVNAGSLLGQLSMVFSGVKLVQRVELSGNATWYAGSLEDSGTVTLTASTDGSSQMQILLATSGPRSETQVGAGSSANCQWAGADGVAHNVSSSNCWKPAMWFLPAFSLQPSLLPNYLGVIDLGTGTVGSCTNVYRHLQSQLVFGGLPNTMTADIMRQSTADLGLDPVTLLPAVLAYSVRPDNSAPASIAVEVRYLDYRAVNGVQIPFHIQRYVNGSLQLDILVNSALVN